MVTGSEAQRQAAAMTVTDVEVLGVVSGLPLREYTAADVAVALGGALSARAAGRVLAAAVERGELRSRVLDGRRLYSSAKGCVERPGRPRPAVERRRQEAEKLEAAVLSAVRREQKRWWKACEVAAVVEGEPAPRMVAPQMVGRVLVRLCGRGLVRSRVLDGVRRYRAVRMAERFA